MKNKTLGIWINVTAIISIILAVVEGNEALLGLTAIALYVFAFIAAHRLGKLAN